MTNTKNNKPRDILNGSIPRSNNRVTITEYFIFYRERFIFYLCICFSEGTKTADTFLSYHVFKYSLNLS